MANLTSRKLNWWWLALLAVLPFTFAFRRRSSWGMIAEPQLLRNDPIGKGHFGAPRGNRKHEGIDLLVKPGQSVLSPIPGTLVRYAAPYSTDSRFGGVLIQGSGEFEGYDVKIFYIQPTIQPGASLSSGSVVGKAQAISIKYGSSTLDHVHVEIRKDGQLIDPSTLLQVNSI